MKNELLKRPRQYTALGLAVLTLSGLAESANAQPAYKTTPLFQLNKDQWGRVIDDPKSVAGTYLEVQNVKQSLVDAAELGTTNSKFKVNITTGGKTNELAFTVGYGDMPENDFYVVPTAGDIGDVSGGRVNAPGTIMNEHRNTMESYIYPVDNKAVSEFGVNNNIQNMAGNAGFNVLGIDIDGLDAVTKVLGFAATGSQYIEVKNAAKGALSLSFGIAEGARTTGLSYQEYKKAIDGEVFGYVLERPAGVKLQVSLPAIPRSSYYGLEPMTLIFAA